MRVLVCGGNEDERIVVDALDLFHQTTPITTLLHNSGKGVEEAASKWAAQMDIPTFSNPVSSDIGLLFSQGRPMAVIAFPGNRRTANAIALARKSNLDVYIIRIKRSPDLAPSDWEVEQ